MSKNAINLGLFLGSYNILFKGSNCLLKNIRQTDDGLNPATAGAIAGTSMYFFKR
jgi:hypothetical protein